MGNHRNSLPVCVARRLVECVVDVEALCALDFEMHTGHAAHVGVVQTADIPLIAAMRVSVSGTLEDGGEFAFTGGALCVLRSWTDLPVFFRNITPGDRMVWRFKCSLTDS